MLGLVGSKTGVKKNFLARFGKAKKYNIFFKLSEKCESLSKK